MWQEIFVWKSHVLIYIHLQCKANAKLIQFKQGYIFIDCHKNRPSLQGTCIMTKLGYYGNRIKSFTSYFLCAPMGIVG
jgi:hypothetical protein